MIQRSPAHCDAPLERVDVNMAMPTERQLSGYAGLSFLYMHSANLRRLSVDAMAARIMPPIALGFFHVLNDDHMPRAALTWGLLSPEVARKFRQGAPLAPADWLSGEEMWVIEGIAPFGGPSARILLNWALAHLDPAHDHFHYLREDRDGRPHRQVTFRRAGQGWTSSVMRLPPPTGDDTP